MYPRDDVLVNQTKFRLSLQFSDCFAGGRGAGVPAGRGAGVGAKPGVAGRAEGQGGALPVWGQQRGGKGHQ